MKAINLDDIRIKNGTSIYSILKSLKYADDFSDKDYDIDDLNNGFYSKKAVYYYRKRKHTKK